MTRTTLSRLMILHLLQIRFTDDFTFISFVPVCYSSPGKVVRGQFNLYLVAGDDANEIHPHFSRHVGKDLMPVIQNDAKHRVRQCLFNNPFNFDQIFSGHNFTR